MNPDSLVTVITTFYNSDKYITEAIESVLSQNYQNWELILVDDGSTDKSTEIALYYTKKYPDKVRYFEHENHENKGMSASRNLGIKNSRGEYVCFLDSDDVYLPQKIKENINVLTSQIDADFVYTSSLYWYSWTGMQEDKGKDYIWNNFGVPPDIIIEPPILLKKMIFDRNTVPCPGSFLVRREVVEQIKGFEEEFTGLFEDQVFYLKLFLNSKGIILNSCWHKYRQHDDSSCSVSNSDRSKKWLVFKFWNWVEDFLLENNVNDFELWKTIRHKKRQFDEVPIRYYQNEQEAKQSTVEIDDNKKMITCLRKKRKKLEKEVKHWKQIAQYDNSEYSKPQIISDNSLLNELVHSIKNRLNMINSNLFKPKNTRIVPFSDPKMVEPVSKSWGWDRGTPIDRFYIEKFLSQNAQYIKGNVLEINDDKYTKKFGGKYVTTSDVLDIDEQNKDATLIADLQKADNIKSNRFDCIILTQTLQLTYDYDSVIKNCKRILRKGGVLLATFPGITKILVNKPFKWYWSFSNDSAEKMFSKYFDLEQLEIYKYGNVLSASAFLYGMSAEELNKEELTFFDPHYEVIIAVSAINK